MGLQSQLNDFSSDSLPLFFLAFLANFLHRLRHFLLHSCGFSRFALPLSTALPDQLHLNRILSYRYGGDDSVAADCLVCLSAFSDGDRVRRLACRHVFHTDCLDGWLHHLNFNCPLCRSPLVADERVPATRRRVVEDLIAWFAVR